MQAAATEEWGHKLSVKNNKLWDGEDYLDGTSKSKTLEMARESASENSTQAALAEAEAHLVCYKVPFIAISRVLYVTTLIYPVPLSMSFFEGRRMGWGGGGG